MTPDSLLSLPEPIGGRHYELSDGELIVAGNAGALDELIKTRLVELLTIHQFRTSSGRVFSETQFTLRADRARVSDAAWVSKERLSLIPRDNHAIPIAPDIAIEIAYCSEQKLRDYLEADVEVWQVFPATQTVTVWRGNLGHRLTGEQLLTSDRLPDFSVAVADIFA